MDDIKTMSPSTLAFMGDAVYGLLVRERLCRINRPSGELHRRSVKYVSATAQDAAYTALAPLLTEEEAAVFHRGRNFRTSNTPKSASAKQYHTATGLETLFGWWYLTGQTERMRAMFDHIVKNTKIGEDGDPDFDR